MVFPSKEKVSRLGVFTLILMLLCCEAFLVDAGDVCTVNIATFDGENDLLRIMDSFVKSYFHKYEQLLMTEH